MSLLKEEFFEPRRCHAFARVLADLASPLSRGLLSEKGFRMRREMDAGERVPLFAFPSARVQPERQQMATASDRGVHKERLHRHV